MLTGTIAGGVLAQVTNLGLPYVLRAVMLGLTFAVAWRAMHDVGFVPRKGASVTQRPVDEDLAEVGEFGRGRVGAA